MNVLKNTKEDCWELWDVTIETVVDTIPLGFLTNKEAGEIFLQRMFDRVRESKKLIRGILDHREDYSVILMPDWVDTAEDYVK